MDDTKLYPISRELYKGSELLLPGVCGTWISVATQPQRSSSLSTDHWPQLQQYLFVIYRFKRLFPLFFCVLHVGGDIWSIMVSVRCLVVNTFD